jgi:hypothetical protein
MALTISPQNKAAMFALWKEFASQYPAVQQAANQFCALNNGQQNGNVIGPMGPAQGGGGGNGNGNGNGQNGYNMGGSNGSSCACNIPGTKPAGSSVPALPGNTNVQQCGIPTLPQGGGSEVGTWNCEQVDRDIAPCDLARIMREEKLPTVVGELVGPIAAGAEIAVEFADIGLAHSLCIDYIRVTISDNADPPTITTVAIPLISLQPEIIAQLPAGPYDHVWDYGDPERPDYLGITDGRCRCAYLCVCVSALAHARLVFTLPEAVDLGETLRVEVWGRRMDWGRVCGPCPPCDICDRTPLTPAEEAAADDVVYEIS